MAEPDKMIAKYLVTGRNPEGSSSLSLAALSAAQALNKLADLEAQGFSVTVVDIEGQALSRNELEAEATAERRAAT